MKSQKGAKDTYAWKSALNALLSMKNLLIAYIFLMGYLNFNNIILFEMLWVKTDFFVPNREQRRFLLLHNRRTQEIYLMGRISWNEKKLYN